ncbi:MAG: hypothetical protein ACRDD1_08990, partial [Planctomycetia bacterium]
MPTAVLVHRLEPRPVLLCVLEQLLRLWPDAVVCCRRDDLPSDRRGALLGRDPIVLPGRWWSRRGPLDSLADGGRAVALDRDAASWLASVPAVERLVYLPTLGRPIDWTALDAALPTPLPVAVGSAWAVNAWGGRPAGLAHLPPPVDVDFHRPASAPLDPNAPSLYLLPTRRAGGRWRSAVVDAFARMPHRRLVVVALSPEAARDRRGVRGNVAIERGADRCRLRTLLQQASAVFLRDEEETVGMGAAALACGAGALAPPDSPGASLAGAAGRPWGLVVDDAAPDAVAAAVRAWEAATAGVLGRPA